MADISLSCPHSDTRAQFGMPNSREASIASGAGTNLVLVADPCDIDRPGIGDAFCAAVRPKQRRSRSSRCRQVSGPRHGPAEDEFERIARMARSGEDGSAIAAQNAQPALQIGRMSFDRRVDKATVP